MEDIVIYASKLKLLAMAAVCLAFEGFFVHFLLYGLSEGRAPFKEYIPAILYLGAPVVGLLFVYLCYRLLRPQPAVVINREGIFDNASIFSAGLIRWEKIKSVFTYQVMNHSLLGIIPVDLETIIGRQPAIKRFFFKLGGKGSPVPFAIPGGVLPMSAEELLTKIQAYKRAHFPEKV
jgi:hypothetical protein